MTRNFLEDDNHECDYCDGVLRTGDTMISITKIGEREREILCLLCASKAIIVALRKPCVACSGSGWYDGTDEEGNNIPCGGCEGKGYT